MYACFIMNELSDIHQNIYASLLSVLVRERVCILVWLGQVRLGQVRLGQGRVGAGDIYKYIYTDGYIHKYIYTHIVFLYITIRHVLLLPVMEHAGTAPLVGESQGSIPGHWGFFPGHQTVPCTLGSTQPLKMSTRIFLGVKTADA